GALAYSRPEAAVQVMDESGLERLGVAFNLSGQPRADRPALEVRIKTDDETVDQRIDGGHLWIYPLAIGQEAEVQVKVLARGGSIGGKGRVKMKVEGGAAGLIFDARGRLLPLASDVRKRAAQMSTWLAEALRTTPQDIPESWLQPSQSAPAPVRSSRRLKSLDEPQEQIERDLDDLLDDSENEPENIRNVLS